MGHLVDVESLFTGRLDDFDAGVETLRAADMTNQRTHQASHNNRSIEGMLAEFRRVREALVEHVESLEPPEFSRVAFHPRLEKPMRVVDMMLFHAEHDDYHLARISELIKLVGESHPSS